jgi:hypothetical protein
MKFLLVLAAAVGDGDGQSGILSDEKEGTLVRVARR